MAYHIEHYESKEEWIKAHKDRISGTTASAILGYNPYKSNVQAFKEIMKPNTDDKPSEVMQYGIDVEPILRDLFAVDYKKTYEVYDPPKKGYDLVVNDEYPFIIATLDGLLIEKETRRNGIYEGKTATVRNFNQRENWKEFIPQNYYTQCLHQLLATGYDYNVLNALINYKMKNEDKTPREWQEIKQYLITRENAKTQLDFLLSKEIEFYEKYIKTGIEPKLITQEERNDE